MKKYLLAVIFALVINITTNAARAEVSLYPGKERLLIGSKARWPGWVFAVLEPQHCARDFDFKGYEERLRQHSMADWRYFSARSSEMGGDGVPANPHCQQEETDDFIELLDIYIDTIVYLAERCRGRVECPHAGTEF